MCVACLKMCSCGAGSASIHFRDNILPDEVVSGLYCPVCSKTVKFDPDSMVYDNGWIIVYNMDVARSAGRGRISHHISPETLFFEGYCTWNGIYPGDHIDSVAERDEIVSLAKTDPKEYIKRLKTWANDRMMRLAGEGWRKARVAVNEKA